MKFYNDILPNDLLIAIDKERNSLRCEQKWGCSPLFWDENIRIGITGVCASSFVGDNIHTAISDILTPYFPEHEYLYIQHYIWFKSSGICMHDDSSHKFGATLYLNETWDMSSGGIFIWKDSNEYKAICPERNMLALNSNHTSHMVTAVSDLAPEPRYTIQIWGK